jgi:hypothetical protein
LFIFKQPIVNTNGLVLRSICCPEWNAIEFQVYVRVVLFEAFAVEVESADPIFVVVPDCYFRAHLILCFLLDTDKAGNDPIAIHDAQVISLLFLFLSDPQDCEHAPENFCLRDRQLFCGLRHHFHDLIGLLIFIVRDLSQ